MKLFVLATRHPAWRRIAARAQPMMDAFARDLQQSCHLVIPEGGHALVIAQASPIGTWEFRVKIGAQLDLLTSASGQTLLAFQTVQSLPDTLALWGATQLLGGAERVMQAGAQIAAVGYRSAPSAQLFGVQDLSVPICDQNGRAVAALTCAYIARPTPAVVPSHDVALAALITLARGLTLQ